MDAVWNYRFGEVVRLYRTKPASSRRPPGSPRCFSSYAPPGDRRTVKSPGLVGRRRHPEIPDRCKLIAQRPNDQDPAAGTVARVSNERDGCSLPSEPLSPRADSTLAGRCRDCLTAKLFIGPSRPAGARAHFLQNASRSRFGQCVEAMGLAHLPKKSVRKSVPCRVICVIGLMPSRMASLQNRLSFSGGNATRTGWAAGIRRLQ